MRTIKRIMKLKGLDYYIKHLEIVNCLAPANLSTKEIEVLAAFLSVERADGHDLFSPDIRKKVMEMLSLSHGGLSNHISSMIRKKVLSKEGPEQKMYINSLLMPEDDNQMYHIVIKKYEDSRSGTDGNVL